MFNGYLAGECIAFVSVYLNRVETSINRPLGNQEDEDTKVDATNGILRYWSCTDLDDKHRYILFTCGAIDSYLE